MNRPHRFVFPLTEDEITTLREMVKNHSSYHVRRRAHAVLSSSEGFGIDDIALICNADRDSVSSWIGAWEKNGIRGLYDLQRSGSPPKLTEADIEIVRGCINEHPNSPKGILAKSIEKIGKTFSMSTLKRIVKKLNMRWKRVRKSTRNGRDPKKFEKARKEIGKLKERQKSGEIDLYFSDQTGFSLGSYVPYAYQTVGETIEISSARSPRLNVIGFISPDNRFESLCFECTVNTDVIVRSFDEFSKNLTKKTYVVIDNAPIHHSEEFEENIPKWRRKKLYIKYLPAYSPELNLSEIVWKHMKQYWLPVSAYLSYEALVNSVEYILKNIGSEFRINVSP